MSQIVDPFVNPDQANAAAARVLSDTPPLMEIPPPSTIHLLGGWKDPEGKWHKTAVIRDLNGEDEEFIARETQTKFTVVSFVDMILRRMVLQVGPVSSTPEILDDLLTGDRTFLMLKIREVTFGSDWEIEGFPCRLCGQPFDVVIELDKDVKIQEMKDSSSHVIKIPLRNGHYVEASLLNGRVQKEAVGEGGKTFAEETTAVIDGCLKTYDGIPVQGSKLARKMGMKDRKTIVDALNENQPGPNLGEVSVPCSVCGLTAQYPLNLVELFR